MVTATSTLVSPLYAVSEEEGSSRTFHVWSISVRLSSTPVTVTAWVVFHVDVEKSREAGDTRPSLVSWLATATVTAAEGWVCSFTVNVTVVPYSATGLATAPTARPGSNTNTGMDPSVK